MGLDHPLQHGVGRQPDGVQEVVLLQVLVDLRAGKPRIASELLAQSGVGVPPDDRVQ
jgi:hypothetical protein